MPYEVEETGDLSRTVQVSVTTEEYNKQVNKALKEMAKNVKIRGYRKGNVPLSVMKKRYGQNVQQDVIEDLVRSKLNEIISESEQPVIHVGQPNVDSTPEDDEGLKFSVDYELRPEIDPIGYMGLELTKEKTEVSKEDVDERLEQMRHQYATLEPIAFRETIEEGDVVTFDYHALGAEENEALDGIEGENAQIEVGQGSSIPGLEEGLIGAGFDDTVVVEVTPDEGFPVEELQGETFKLQLDIKSVKKQVLPELDDDFAKDTGDAETLLELRGQIREELEEELEHQAMHESEDDLVAKLLEQNEFDLPPQFVEEQVGHERQQRMQMLQQFTQQGMNPEELGIDLEEFTGGEELEKEVKDRVRTDFLLMAIAEKEGLELEQEDLMAHIQHRARHSRVSPQQLMQQLMQDQESLRQANMMALLEKTKRFLLENAEFEEIEPADEEEEAEEAKKPKKAKKAKKSEKDEKPKKAKKAKKSEKDEKPKKAKKAKKAEKAEEAEKEESDEDEEE
jgi:trigger factor